MYRGCRYLQLLSGKIAVCVLHATISVLLQKEKLYLFFARNAEKQFFRYCMYGVMHTNGTTYLQSQALNLIKTALINCKKLFTAQFLESLKSRQVREYLWDAIFDEAPFRWRFQP